MSKHQTYSMTWVEICDYTHLPESVLKDLLDHGLFSETGMELKAMHFDLAMLSRIASASRLHHDLEINSPGIVLAMELLDKLKALEDELSILRRHLEE